MNSPTIIHCEVCNDDPALCHPTQCPGADPHAEHDPLPRKLDEEPHFALLARDPTAADVVRLWLALRKRDASLVDAIVRRLKDTMAKLPYQPHKDQEHILSAQDVANRMDLWLWPRANGNVRDQA